MHKNKLLIIGKNSFLGKNLYKSIKNKIDARILSYEEFLKLNKKKIKNFNYLCNCSLNTKYNKSKYKEKNDIDLKIVKKIKNYKINFIFLSSRKVYLNKKNIKEDDKLAPKCNYSKNKVITEKKIFKLLPNKLIILRISNVLGLKNYSLRRTHNSFIDNYIKYISSNKKTYYENDYKDFITIEQFIKIFYNIIKNNLRGIYNVSLGKKIYIDEILKWLNYKNLNKNKFLIKKNTYNYDSFTLNNKKLMNSIKIKINKSEIKKFCRIMGKKIYYQFNNSI
jgi:dTDP-4-dehydrorhamnose reductase